MFVKLKRAWHRFTEREPGKRFTEMYEEHHAEKKSPIARVGYMALAVVIIIVGLVALPMPGPGTLVLALGFGMIARESIRLARLLDRIEVKGRDLWHRLRQRRKHRTT